MFDWLDLTQIFLQLATCYACFVWGKTTGISDVVELFLEKKLITEQDIEKLKE